MPGVRRADTPRMKPPRLLMLAALVSLACGPSWLLAAGHTHTGHAHKGQPCGCRPTTGGAKTPCGDTGCGPRYWNAVHDEVWLPDPCDACNRWYGCNGARQMPDMLAPWQLPPGRGFMSAEDVGYRAPGPCTTCRPGCWFWPF